MKSANPDEALSHSFHERKRRVGKACDSCRVKKTKCDGKKPCSKCIADNKICAFTDKKKIKEKTHPSGYIDLLETRVDLLTKSLEKVFAMAEPYVPALKLITERVKEKQDYSPSVDGSHSESESTLPINDLVSLLISDLSLLEQEPSQTDSSNNGAQYFAFATDPVSRELNQAKSQSTVTSSNQGSTEVSTGAPPSIDSGSSYPEHGPLFHSLDSPNSATSSNNSLNSPVLNSLPHTALEEASNDNYPLDGYFNPRMSGSEFRAESPLGLNEVPSLTRSSIFGHSRSHSNSRSSLSSISNRLESSTFEDAFSQNLRRSQSTKTHMSHSSQKKRSSGHVHKPPIATYSSHSILAGLQHVDGANVASKFDSDQSATERLMVRNSQSTGESDPFDFDNVFVDDLPSHAIENRNFVLPGEEEYLRANPLLDSVP